MWQSCPWSDLQFKFQIIQTQDSFAAAKVKTPWHLIPLSFVLVHKPLLNEGHNNFLKYIKWHKKTGHLQTFSIQTCCVEFSFWEQPNKYGKVNTTSNAQPCVSLFRTLPWNRSISMSYSDNNAAKSLHSHLTDTALQDAMSISTKVTDLLYSQTLLNCAHTRISQTTVYKLIHKFCKERWHKIHFWMVWNSL